jgi:hypothetical protein
VRAQEWAHPIGTPVDVRTRPGETLRTKTRSDAWDLGDGRAGVVLIEGRTGGYCLDFVTPVRDGEV